MNSPDIVKMIKEQMDLIVEHVKAHTDNKLKIKEFVCYFKFKSSQEFYLLFCNQLRIHSISLFDTGSPHIILSGNCRVPSAHSAPR